MHHPQSRVERRWNGEVWRNRQRAKMKSWWRTPNGQSAEEYWQDNNMWWGRKQTSGHGNRCLCHYEKFSSKEIRKRRRALDAAIIDNINGWEGGYMY